MKDYKIGKAIFELRSYFKISQRELAKNLCDQSLISRIEKNEIHPSAPILYEIAKRLGVDINYFFADTYIPLPHFDYAKETCRQIRLLITERNYKEALEMVKLEESNPLFRKKDLARFLLWTKGVCIFYLEKNIESAINYIDEALALTQTTYKNFCEEEIEILISKAVIYSVDGQFDTSMELYSLALHHHKRLPVHGDTKVEMRLYYNLSKISHERKIFVRAIEYADKGILCGLQNNLLYLLGHLYYQKGESYLYIGDNEKACDFMTKSLWVFEQTNQTEFYNYVKDEIDKVLAGTHPKDFSGVT